MERSFLMIDDDPDDVYLLESCLKEVDPEVRFYSAEDGEAGLAWLRNKQHPKPGVVFVDLNMPRMNGKQFLAEMQKDPYMATVPVFVFTTSSYTKDIEECLQAGAACFITKPVDMAQLRDLVAHICAHLQGDLRPAIEALKGRHKLWVLQAD